MKGGRLSSRLNRIREQSACKAPPPPQAERITEKKAERGGELPGWVRQGDFLFERSTRFPLPEDKGPLSAYLPLLFPREREFLESVENRETLCTRLLFFDLETTGLSHGTGTVAFMAALARLEGNQSLSVTQLLLSDYPGESDFLGRFIELAGENPVLVSFNGKGFDSQILATRFLMNGMRPRFLSAPHLDLLYPSRRLWKSELANCRLGTIEAQIFGQPREGDLPGSEAPDAWFDYLRSGNQCRLLEVGEHNLEDARSLARLLFELDRRIAAAEGRAALIRALDLRSRKDYEAAATLLAPLSRSGDPLASRILAVDAEHRLGRLELALELARSLDDERRVARLEAKLRGAEDLWQ